MDSGAPLGEDAASNCCPPWCSARSGTINFLRSPLCGACRGLHGDVHPGARTRLASFSAGLSLRARGGLDVGDDHRVVTIVVQAEEAQVGQGAETGGAQVGQDSVAAGGRYPDEAALDIGQSEGAQAVAVVFAGVVRAVRLPGAALGGDGVPSTRTTSPPCLAIFFRVRSRRGAFAASKPFMRRPPPSSGTTRADSSTPSGASCRRAHSEHAGTGRRA